MARDSIFINARLIDPEAEKEQKGGLHISGKTIRAKGPDITKEAVAGADATIIDCKNMCLAPGLVDIRVQLREPGEAHKESMETAVDAALAGGVTTMVCLPDTKPVIDDVSVIEFVSRRGREVKGSKIYCYGAATKNLEGVHISEYGLLKKAGALGFTDGAHCIHNSALMACAMRYAKGIGAPLIQHAQDPHLAKKGVMNEGELSMRLGLKGIPASAEAIIIERDLHLLEMIGGHYHVAHISTAAGLEAVRRGRAKNLNITCDTAPHYFALNEHAVGDYRTFAKVNPPLQSEADRQAVLEAISEGTIDCIASDHAPQDQDSKRLPFDLAAFGIIGLETLLPLSLEIYHNRHLDLIRLIRLLTTAPASLTGLEAGNIRKGAPADLILFDPERPHILREEKIRSKSKNTPFENRSLQGMVLQSWVDGRCLFDREKMLLEESKKETPTQKEPK